MSFPVFLIIIGIILSLVANITIGVLLIIIGVMLILVPIKQLK
jgi:hypothetical protein